MRDSRHESGVRRAWPRSDRYLSSTPSTVLLSIHPRAAPLSHWLASVSLPSRPHSQPQPNLTATPTQSTPSPGPRTPSSSVPPTHPVRPTRPYPTPSAVRHPPSPNHPLLIHHQPSPHHTNPHRTVRYSPV